MIHLFPCDPPEEDVEKLDLVNTLVEDYAHQPQEKGPSGGTDRVGNRR